MKEDSSGATRPAQEDSQRTTSAGKKLGSKKHKEVSEWLRIDCAACRDWSTTRMDLVLAMKDFVGHCSDVHPKHPDPPFVRTHTVSVTVYHDGRSG